MMMDYAIVPHWFLGYSVLLELVFALITLLVGAYALKIYMLTNQRQHRLFGVAFIMISASYLIQSALNFISGYQMAGGCIMQSMSSMHYLSILGIYFHIILFTLGLSTLAYMALKIRNWVIYFVLVAVPIAALFLSSNTLYSFYVISSILLIYISFHYLRNYLSGRKKNALLIFIALLFLLFAKIHFIFSIDHGLFYVLGHILEFVAYALILINFISVVKGK